MAAADRPIKPLGYSDKQTVKVITVDKERNRVECAMRDGAMIWAAVWDTPTIFRWPKPEEIWTVRKDMGIWRLDAQVQSVSAENLSDDISLSDLKEGETRILGDTVHVQTLSAQKIIGGGGDVTSELFLDAREWIGSTPSLSDKGPQLQEALDAAKELGPGARLILPPWEVVTAQTLFVASRMTLEGHSWGASGIKLGDNSNVSTLSVEEYGSVGINDFAMREFFLNGNKAKNSLGHCLKIDGSRFVIENMRIFNAPETNLDAIMTFEGVDTEGGMDSFIQNLKCWLGGKYNVRIDGHDWHLQNVIGIKKEPAHETTNILIDSNAVATKLTNVHAWGECKYAWHFKGDCEAINCEAEGGVTANVLLDTDNGLWLGGKVFVDDSAHGKKGFLWGKEKGFNWQLDSIHVVGCIEGAFDMTECDGGASRINGNVEQASGEVFIGTPSNLAKIDLNVYGGVTYEPPTGLSNPIIVGTSSSGEGALATLVSGESFGRYEFQGSGQMGWGPGTSGADVFLQRNAVEVLKIIGSLQVSGNLQHFGSKLGFFNKAATTRPNVKPPAEVTAKELGEALETLGLIE